MSTISTSIISTSSTAAVIATAGDPLTIGVNAIVVTTSTSVDAVAILANDSNSTIAVLGDLRAEHTDAILLDGTNMHLSIGAKASVYGDDHGVRTEASHNTVINAGEILSSRGTAVYFHDGNTNSLTNTGSIRSLSGAAVFFDDGNNTLVNTGLIESLDADGWAVSFAENGMVTNKGTIIGDIGIRAGAALIVNNAGGTIGDTGTTTGILGSTGADRVTNTGVIRGSSDAINFGLGNDFYNGAGGQLIGRIAAGFGNDTLIGGAFADVLLGQQDNDTLAGGGGADTLDGSFGDDIYQLGADTTDTVIDSSGSDLIYSTITRSLASYPTIEKLTLQGTANINGTGNALSNQIMGNSGKNTLTGGDGHDTLNGGAGVDILNGGNGDDLFVLGAENDTVIDTGTNVSGDFIESSISRSLAGYATIENLALSGTANINGTGNGLNNSITGNAGNNVLKGGAGADTISGSIGIDTLVGEAGNDQFFYLNFLDSPFGGGRDVISDFDKNGDDVVNLTLLAAFGVHQSNSAVNLAPSGANTLATLVVSGTPVMQFLLTGTTIGPGVGGHVDASDFLLAP